MLQCKRTNIGVALITGPRVLFMDEPTSGLDSYTSNEVRRTSTNVLLLLLLHAINGMYIVRSTQTCLLRRS